MSPQARSLPTGSSPLLFRISSNTFFPACLTLMRSLSRRRCFQTLAERFLHSSSPTGATTELVPDNAEVVDMSKWSKLDSRALGIVHSVIPSGPWTVLKVLRSQGFDAYLVGGCVRDLLLKRTPKDFDVITTANLGQIKEQFTRAQVVGSRFPICRVHIQNSVTEVSSFETVARQTGIKEEVDVSQAPQGCKMDDYIRWKNSFKRDFTINSLFLDPFANKIYDYSRGMSDLKSLKLRTIISAEESFEEDCARILRGLRIAARLGLSFSNDTEAAVHKLSETVADLPKGRIFMELNSMFSYGASEPSLCLLQRFSLLKIILPFHAAYLEKQTKPENTNMLMKLFSNLDKVAQCDHPSNCRLWVGILAFHLALVNNPEDAFVAVTLASILYHGEWEEGIRYARKNAVVQVHFKPELSTSFVFKSDKELAEEVSRLAASVQASVDILTESKCLQESMFRYTTKSWFFPVFVSKTVGRNIAELFQMLVKRNASDENRRVSFAIDYHLLGRGFMWETRFVLGKIILETLGCATSQQSGEIVKEKNNIDTEAADQNCKYEIPSLLREQFELFRKSGKKRNLDTAPKDRGVIEVKKRKSNNKKRSMDKQHDSLNEAVEEKKKACTTKKRKGKNETSSMDDEFEFGEVVMEDKAAKKKPKSKSEEIVVKKKGEQKKKPRQKKNVKPAEKRRDLKDDVAAEKKHEVEVKQTTENHNRRKTLLSSLFAR